MAQQNESVKKLEVGKDYINVHDNNVIIIDKTENIINRGFEGGEYKIYMSCLYTSNWREATEEEVVKAFEKHLIHRYGEDWKTMKIKERHPSLSSAAVINNGLWDVEIYKEFDGWNVCNRNGLLYCNGIWVERLEEKKIHIKEAIKENTVIHCETEGEAERILNMAHKLGYKWCTGRLFEVVNNWGWNKDYTCYYLFKGTYNSLQVHNRQNYTIIPSTQIADLEEAKSTDWTPAPEDIEEMNKKASEKRPIDKVTTEILDIALRMVGIQLDVNIIDKVIDLVELIENKGGDVTIEDIVSLQQTWSRHLQAFH